MVMDALRPFRPTGGRIIVNKMTGESRGFAFVEFDSIDDARHVVQTFAKQPLSFQGRLAAIGPLRLDLPHGRYPNYSATTSTFCVQSGAQCNATNFAKRLECYKCSAPKSEYAIEVPRQVADMTHNQSGHPSCILAVRSLPMEAQEEELTQLFMRYPGVKDIRLMRDRITGAPRGFGFVEFATVEHATAALQAIGSEFYYANALVRVSYSMDAATAPRVLGPNAHMLANSAVEAAQWSSSNAYKPLNRLYLVMCVVVRVRRECVAGLCSRRGVY
ncbi:hypothetical protein AaE_004119 [Aphanomyces astaci]|uniref:RRM domain-containing protein n=1 Tax=Aphanomyces astaci TaxID=112090 RepID=A0A6A5ABE4_APHAT|nr:hypothetical protein AaE_004119 [Aphanomyces astaci]